jgi:hypothetical protein
VLLIVLDAEILASAVLLPTSAPRKLLVLMAYGSVAQWLDIALPQERATMAEAAGSTGTIADVDALVEENTTRRAALRAALPKGAPDDVCLIGYPPIFDDAIRIVRQRARDNSALWAGVASHLRLNDASFDVLPEAEQPSRLRRLLRAGASAARIAAGVGGVDLGHPPVYAAHQTGGLLLTSNAELLARYREVVRAREFNEFLDDPPWGRNFDLDDVDGQLLSDPAVWSR